MKFYKLMLAFCGLAGFAVTPAMVYADYQSEISYFESYYDIEGGTEISYGKFTYKRYFESISSTNRPFAEAAYLQRASSIEVGLYGYVAEYSGGDETVGGGLGFIYTMMNEASPFFLKVLLDTSSSEYNSSGGTTVYERDMASWGLSLGWFIGKSTSVDVNVIKTDTEYSPSSYASNNYDTTDIYLNAKSVILSDGDTAINVEGLIGKDDYRNGSNTVIGVAADYYFNSRMSAGGSFTSESGDSEGNEGQYLGIRGRFFFIEKLSLSAEFVSFTADTSSGDYDRTSVEILYRF